MEYSISFCGLECDKCPAYIAKTTNNNDLRIKTAKLWSSVGFTIKPEDVNCDGCHSNGILLGHCSTCKVRHCGLERGYTTCAECGDYPCQNLQTLWKELHAEEAKETLDSLR